MVGGEDRGGGPQKADQRDGQDQSRRGGGVPAPEQQPGGGKRRENSREPQRDRVRMERDGEDQAQPENPRHPDQPPPPPPPPPPPRGGEGSFFPPPPRWGED